MLELSEYLNEKPANLDSHLKGALAIEQAYSW